MPARASSPRPAPGGRRPTSAVGRWARATAGALLLGVTACESPRLQASAQPADATLFIDGIAQPASTVEKPISYYGGIEVAATPRADARPKRFARRTTVEIDEPVTPWVFPFDFLGELAVAAFVEDPLTEVAVELPERDDVPERRAAGDDQTKFVERARQASWER